MHVIKYRLKNHKFSAYRESPRNEPLTTHSFFTPHILAYSFRNRYLVTHPEPGHHHFSYFGCSIKVAGSSYNTKEQKKCETCNLLQTCFTPWKPWSFKKLQLHGQVWTTGSHQQSNNQIKTSSFRTGSDVIVSKDELLCHTPTHADVHLSQQLSSRLTPAVILWQHGHLEDNTD